MTRRRPRSFMEWVVGSQIPDYDQPLPRPRPPVSERRARSPRRHVLVHVETSDTDSRYSSSSDDSPVSTLKSPKRVHFDQSTKKSALKARSPEKRDSESTSNGQYQSDRQHYCCSCSESESKAKAANGQYKGRPQPNQNPNHNNTTCKNCNKGQSNNSNNNSQNKCHQQSQNQRTQAGQSQNQTGQGNPQGRNNYPRNPNYNNSATPSKKTLAQLSFLHKNMTSRTVHPARGIVVIREDVIECPSDPRPNAFFDSVTGVMRVYHGPIYGNPLASTVPSPNNNIPLGSSAPQGAHWNSGMAPNQQYQQPAGNTGWANAHNKQGSVPGGWPSDNNDGNRNSSEWNNESTQASGCGWPKNDSSNNNDPSGWGVNTGWGQNTQASNDNINNNNSSANDGGNNNQSNTWGSGGVDNSKDNQPSNNTWGDDSNNQSNNNSWGDNSNNQSNNNSWGDNSNNNANHFPSSPGNNTTNGNNDDSWGQPKVTASWGDMSAAQSTQGNGNNSNDNSGNSWGGGNNNNNTNSGWGNSGPSGGAWDTTGNGANQATGYSGW